MLLVLALVGIIVGTGGGETLGEVFEGDVDNRPRATVHAFQLNSDGTNVTRHGVLLLRVVVGGVGYEMSMLGTDVAVL